MGNSYDIQSLQLVAQQECLTKIKALKERFNRFETIDSLEEAKTIVKEVFRAEKEFQEFSIGDVKCTIINREDLFRISYDSSTEFICYNFE